MAIQPPSDEKRNDWGKWRSVKPCGPQLVLERGAEHAGLDAGGPGGGVDLEHLVEAVERDRDELSEPSGGFTPHTTDDPPP